MDLLYLEDKLSGTVSGWGSFVKYIIKSYYLMRKENIKKKKKHMTCCFGCIQTPICILGILDYFLDPENSGHREDKFGDSPTASSTQNHEVDQFEPGDKDIIPDTDRNLLTQAEEVVGPEDI